MNRPTAPTTIATITGRRRRRVALGAAVGGAALLLAACTPSGYKAEHAATAQVHNLITGASNNPGAVSCGEFTNTGTNVHEGNCTIYGVTYAVRSTYANQNQTASIAVGRWTGEGGTCSVIKAGDNWLIAQWAGNPVCTMN